MTVGTNDRCLLDGTASEDTSPFVIEARDIDVAAFTNSRRVY